MKKLILSALLACALALPGLGAFAAAQVIVIDGVKVDIPADMGSLREQDDYTFVPVRFLSEYLQCKVNYNPAQQSATVTDANNVSYLMLRGSSDLFVLPSTGNAAWIRMYSPAFLDDAEGRMYIPIRSFAEAMGYTVGWDEASQTASLTLAK